MSFSNFMKNLREEKQLTQIEISEILDVSATSIKKIESGVTKFPSTRVLNKLMEYTGKSDTQIALEILFEEELEEMKKLPDSSRLSFLKLLSDRYLAGWNVFEKKTPRYSSDDSINYYKEEAKLTSRRDVKNVVFIYGYRDFEYYEKCGILFKAAAYDIFSLIVGRVICSNEECRKIQLVFDLEKENHRRAYGVFMQFLFKKIPMDFELVLYNGTDPVIEKVASVKEKNKR